MGCIRPTAGDPAENGMDPFPNLSAAQLRRAADLKDQIETLQVQLGKSLGGHVGNAVVPTKVHWTQTPTGRRKMARLMKKNWKARKKKA